MSEQIYRSPSGEAILITCEGGGHRGHLGMWGFVMCCMCGQWFDREAGVVVPAHDRDDVLARIERGDFG